jgi:ribosomal protein L3 glutamine methyltransferase
MRASIDPFQEAAAQFVTLRDCLRLAVSRFNAAGLCFGHGADNAWDEAVYLALFSLKLPLDRLEPFLDARLLPAERAAFFDLCRRRVTERMPAAYLTGEAWLAGYRFTVDTRVIVPRSFLARPILERFTPWLDENNPPTRILDMCAGSACLAILAALAFPEATVDAVDISPDALAVAEQNVADYGLQNRVRLLASDAFAALDATHVYDLIISNPPYVDAAAVAALPPEYRQEPLLALSAGGDGLDFIRRLLSAAPERLAAGGALVVEIGHQRAALEAAFPDTPFTWLSTDAGDDYVFFITRDELPRAHARQPSS